MSVKASNRRGGMGRHAITALKIGVTLGFLLWAFSVVDLDAILDKFGELDLVLCIAAVLVQCAQIPVGAYRWKTILADDGVTMPLRNIVSYLMIGLLFNQLLPSTIGGDGARVWLTARAGIGWSRAFGAVAVDRAAAILMALVLTAALLPVLLPIIPEGSRRSSLVALVLISVACMAVILPIAPWAADRAVARLPDRRSLRPLVAAARLSAILWRRGRTTATISLSSILIHASNVLTVCFFAASIGVTVNLLQLFALILPVMLMLALPVSIAGWGLREGLMVTALGFLGVDPAAAITISLLWGAVTLFGGMLGGIALWRCETGPMDMEDSPTA